MRKILFILAFILPFIGNRLYADGSYNERMLMFSNPTPQSRYSADSIMKIIIAKAEQYANAVDSYTSEIYIKGRTEITKKNWLIQFAPNILPVDRRNNDMLFEMISESSFFAPNNFKHTIKAVNGNTVPNQKKQDEVLTFLNMNVYSPVIYNENIIMPVARNSSRVYDYNLEEVEETSDGTVYKIRFLPKQWSQKLVSGDMWVKEDAWAIERINMNGKLDFANFDMTMYFGKDFRRFTLPEKADLHLRYSILGNVIETNYHAHFSFSEVVWITEDNEETEKWKPLDLTQYYTITVDTIPIVSDSLYWHSKRDIPLTVEEQTVLNNVIVRTEKKGTTNTDKFLDISEQLTSTMSFDYRSTKIRYSGILNPFQLDYSPRDGITYKQRIRINKTYNNGRRFYFRPELGFVFKRKEVFYKVYGEWLYNPEKKGSISILLANGNQSYSSEIMKEINQHLKDSVFDFKDLDLEYFRDYYVELHNNIELTNGLLMETGLSFHNRIPVKKKAAIDPGDEVEDLINDTYYDFVPSIGFSYTPRQFYRMDGREKVYVYSYYPTISIEYARAIPLADNSGDYGRIEVDIHQSLPVGLLRKINYHVSAGMYYNDKSTYFADFRYFTRRNYADSWNDGIGGVFHLLNRDWFYASDKYVQAHLMYESPYAILKFFDDKAGRHIFSERFYLGQLWTPALPSYTEVGYGFGNHIFNVGIFAGFERLDFQKIGFKFSFEL